VGGTSYGGNNKKGAARRGVWLTITEEGEGFEKKKGAKGKCTEKEGPISQL